MENDTNKIIEEQLNSLPDALRNTILNSGWEKKVHDLAKKHQLHIDQEGDLVNETFLVLLGLELAKNFQQNLIGNMHVDQTTAEALVNEIGAEIFAQIREHLQNIEAQEEPVEEKIEEPTEILNKEDILKEIEDPTPTNLPQIIQTKEVSATPVFEVEPIAKPVEETTTKIEVPKTPEVTSPDIISQKLTSVTHQPAENIEVPVKKPLIDPYREPIN